MNIKLLVTLFSVLSLSVFNSSNSNSNKPEDCQILVSGDTLTFEIYDDPITAGEVFSMDIYSSNFTDIVAFQFAFDIPNVEFVELQEGNVPLIGIESYWVDEEEQFRFLWFSSSTLPLSIDPGQPLFTIVFKPETSTTISELITLNESFLASEAVPGNLDATPILLEFTFLERQASTVSDSQLKDITVYPSQFGIGQQSIIIDGLTVKDVSVHTFDGRRIQGVSIIDNNTIQATFQTVGIYVIKVFDGKDYHTELVTVN